MRLQEANTWIRKHNERIRSTGTLRTRAQFNEKQTQQTVEELPKQAKNKEKAMPKQRRTKSKIHKGFVCRSWATNFLPKAIDGENENDEFIPFFVRKYVNNSESKSTDTKKDTASPPLPLEETSENVYLPSTEAVPEEQPEQNTTENIIKQEIKSNRKPYVDENNNEERHARNRAGNYYSLQNISPDFTCCCGGRLVRDKISRSKSTLSSSRIHRTRSKSSKETSCVTLPIKQFPPINPLEGIEKANFSARRKRGVLPTRRPHTVDTALLAKEAILVNGHHNVPSYLKFNCIDATLSQENVNREKQIFSRAKFEKEYVKSKTFDQVWKPSSMAADRNGERTLDKKATAKCIFNEEQNDPGRSGHNRSFSDSLGKEPESSSGRFDENQNVLFRDRGNNSLVRTPPQLLKEDHESNTDSNDTGLGSEIEYTFRGSAKLDAYLQPRGES